MTGHFGVVRSDGASLNQNLVKSIKTFGVDLRRLSDEEVRDGYTVTAYRANEN